MSPRRILVVAPHLDDEVLGAGGSMCRWAAQGDEVTVAVVTRGTPPLYDDADEARCRAEARAAHDRMGIRAVRFLDFPAGALDGCAHRELNAGLLDCLRACAPDEVYLPFPGDLHVDHQRVFLAGMVAVRPNRPGHPSAVYAYETLSETNWNAPFLTPGFIPNHFVDISAFLETKLRAMNCYRSQLAPFPGERSLKALEALAVLRGATVGLAAAEAFVTIRTIN
jgi:LmbE family N-acetylglucosaminyl deacetylase